jgi:methyl-accepting chemotaxis protein
MKNISIKAQVLGLIIFPIILLSVILAWVAIGSAKDALMEKSHDALTSTRDSKAKQIQSFFDEKIGDINVMTKSKDVKELVEDLIYVHEELNVQGNDNYPVTNPLAKEKTLPHEDFFSKLCKRVRL